MDNKGGASDLFSNYVEAGLQLLIIAHLEDALARIENSEHKSIQLMLAARSVHLALVTALTAALSGSHGTGAMTKMARKQWIEYFENPLQGFAKEPTTFMESYDALFKQATDGPKGFLKITEDDRKRLETILLVRNIIEHPRPEYFLMAPDYLIDAINAAFGATKQCLKQIASSFDYEDEKALQEVMKKLEHRLIVT